MTRAFAPLAGFDACRCELHKVPTASAAVVIVLDQVARTLCSGASQVYMSCSSTIETIVLFAIVQQMYVYTLGGVVVLATNVALDLGAVVTLM